MITFQQALQGVAGLFGGGPAQLQATAAYAALPAKYAQVRSQLLKQFQDFGTKWGAAIGPDFFKALEQGASPAAAAANSAQSKKLFGIDVTGWTPTKIALLLAVPGALGILLIIYLIRRARR